MGRTWGNTATVRRTVTAVALACTAGLVGACAETKLAVHTAKTVTASAPSAPARMGAYKVGNPYQIGGVWYHPKEDYDYREEGMASWYGPGFDGKLTANGEVYDQNAMTAAHRTLPLPSMVRVTNLENGRALVLRINDRGPFAKNRIIDISHRGAQLLGFVNQGTARVRVEIMPEESLALKRALRNGGGTPDDMPVITAAPRATVQAAVLDSPPVTMRATAQLPAPAVPLVSTAAAAVPPATTVAAMPPATTVAAMPPATTVAAMPGGVFVQAGAFSSAENVRRLEDQLRGLAPVVVTPIEVDGRQLLRVRLGPISSDADAQRILAAVQAQGLPGARVVQD